MTVPRLLRVGKKPFTVRRKAPGHYDSSTGDWISGSETTLTVEGNMQPLSGYEMQMLPESFRSRESRKLYCVAPVYSIREAESKEPDIVEADGKDFEVHKVKQYQMGVLDHFEATLIRVEQSGGA